MYTDIPIIGALRTEQRKTEVCRSFSYKLNLQNHGGPAYESADFFASRKMECSSEDAAWVSQQIFEECVAEVRTAVAAFTEEMRRRIKARKEQKRLEESV
jgi:hypothetical protein